MQKQSVLKTWLVLGTLTLFALTGCAGSPTALAAAAPPAVSKVSVENETALDIVSVSAEVPTDTEAAALDTASEALASTGISDVEAAGLRFMREEEKLAHDVYIALYDIWGLPIFQNIANSEQTHTEAVLTLLERYGIADPVADNGIGVFTDATLQGLYDQLVAQGSQSLGDALKVGAAIEEIDILDLEERSAQTDHADIQLVYANLNKGSRNHLRAFTQTLLRQTGETYIAQYMTQDVYHSITSADIERGSSGQGSSRQGNGRRNRP